MSNLNLMVGDWVIKDSQQVKVFHIDRSEERMRINYIWSYLYEPIPLSPEVMEKIEGMEKYEFDHKNNQYRYGDRLFVIRDGKIVDYGSSLILTHLHQLQQLIRLFTGKEIEVKWD